MLLARNNGGSQSACGSENRTGFSLRFFRLIFNVPADGAQPMTCAPPQQTPGKRQPHLPGARLLAFDRFNDMRRLLGLRLFDGGEASGFGTAADFERFLSHDDFLIGIVFQWAGGMPPASLSNSC